MSLLIVESPAKGRKIQKFLQGTDITVTSSFGHINGLNTDELDDMISNNFTPIYKNARDKAKTIKELKTLSKRKDIILAFKDIECIHKKMFFNKPFFKILYIIKIVIWIRASN